MVVLFQGKDEALPLPTCTKIAVPLTEVPKICLPTVRVGQCLQCASRLVVCAFERFSRIGWCRKTTDSWDVPCARTFGRGSCRKPCGSFGNLFVWFAVRSVRRVRVPIRVVPLIALNRLARAFQSNPARLVATHPPHLRAHACKAQQRGETIAVQKLLFIYKLLCALHARRNKTRNFVTCSCSFCSRDKMLARWPPVAAQACIRIVV